MIIALLAAVVGGATWTADCDSSSITIALASMNNGDTVTIGVGACTTSGTFTINKSGWVKGTSSQNTKIYKSNNGNLISFQPPNENATVISDILFSGNSGQSLIHITNTTSNKWLIRNCKFRSNDTASYSSIGVGVYSVSAYGCISNCQFNSSRVNVYDNNYLSWKKDASIGTDSMIYVENCRFQRFVSTGAGNAVDANYGGRYCLRFDTIINANIEAHSFQESFSDDSAYQLNDTVYAKSGKFNVNSKYIFFESTLDTVIEYVDSKKVVVLQNREIGSSESLVGISTNINNTRRGTRYYEVYNNVFYNKNAPATLFWVIRPRAGSGAIYNNIVTDSGGANKFSMLGNLDNSRSSSDPGTYTYVAQSCDGNNPIDGNTVGLEGWPALDQIGRGKDNGLDSADHHPQDSVPLYIWNNTFYGSENDPFDVYANRRDSLHIVAGRDFIHGTRSNNAAYTYPHPNTMFYRSNRKTVLINIK
jgi:hypothetical protein